ARPRSTRRSGVLAWPSHSPCLSAMTLPDNLSLAPRDRQVIAARGAGIELARPSDLLIRILDHLLPLRDPADRARDREQHGEHRSREAHRLERDAGIEVDVRIELLLDEILVVQRDAFELERDVEQRIVLDAELSENLVAGALHDLGARIVVLVDPVAEAHQPE